MDVFFFLVYLFIAFALVMGGLIFVAIFLAIFRKTLANQIVAQLIGSQYLRKAKPKKTQSKIVKETA